MIVVDLPWPPSVNRYWRNNRGRTHISHEGRAYREEVLGAVRRQRAALHLEGSVTVLANLHPPDRRRRDVDNVCKALLDALAHAGVYGDDSQIDDLRLRRLAPCPGGKMLVHVSCSRG